MTTTETTNYMAYIMGEDELELTDIRTLDRDRLVTLRAEAIEVGDSTLTATIDTLL